MAGSNPQGDRDEPCSSMEDLADAETGDQLKVKLLHECTHLLQEVEELEQYVVGHRSVSAIELRHFKSSVKTELSHIRKLSASDPSDPWTLHALKSSNLPFYCAVWETVKRCTGVVALGKRFYCKTHDSKGSEAGSKGCPSRLDRRTSVLVDVVAENGLEWVKVNTLTEKRLLFDMAKAGWLHDSSSEDNDVETEQDEESEGLLKQAMMLRDASQGTRVRYRRPRLRMVLPKVRRGQIQEIDQLIDKVSCLGVHVETAESLLPAPPISAALSQVAVNPFCDFSDVLNVDCTILLALVSDLSHSRVQAEYWHHRAILRQIEMEKVDPLLPNSLWPAMGSRHLVCTRAAAQRMQEIVDLIGTPTERQRRDCLLIVDSTSEWPREQRLQAISALSEYSVPLDWKLPIRVIHPDIIALQTHLPATSREVEKILSPINQSVFFYGWATGRTTISSNRTVAKEIESTVEKFRCEESEAGPHIWLCATARSLVGKEKTKGT